MRMRVKKHLTERLEKVSGLMFDTEAGVMIKRAPDRPLMVEIGCGRGAFITVIAEKHPDIDFIAVETVKNVIVSAMEKVAAKKLTNVRFICNDAAKLAEWIEPFSVDRIFLNFSDPWPKKRHFKNRLTNPSFLDVYKKVLVRGGGIWQKTDNLDLFEYSLESYKSKNCILKNLTYDLHCLNPDNLTEEAKAVLEENIMTEYETRFTGMGQPIFRVEAYFPEEEQTEQ